MVNPRDIPGERKKNKTKQTNKQTKTLNNKGAYTCRSDRSLSPAHTNTYICSVPRHFSTLTCMHTYTHRERERDRERERERERERDRQTDRQTDREREGETDRQTEIERQRQKNRQTVTEQQRQ